MRNSARWLLVSLFVLTQAAAAPAVLRPTLRTTVPTAKPAPAPLAKPIPAAAPTKAAAAAAQEAYVLRGPLDVPMLAKERQATITHSPLASGALDDLFDFNMRTALRPAVPAGGAAGPAPVAFVQIVLSRPRPVELVDITFADSERCSWTLAAADSMADLQARKGSYRLLSAARQAAGDQSDQIAPTPTRPYRIYRLEWRHVAAPGAAGLAEWALWSPQELARVEADTFAPAVACGAKIQLRANGTFDAGARQNLTPEATWAVIPATAGHVDELGRFQGDVAGPAQVVATFSGKRSTPLKVTVLPQGLPDWDVTYIELQPRSQCDDRNGQPKVGQNVYWFAHVKNYGTADADRVPIEWRVDGLPVRAGQLPKLDRFSQTEAIFTQTWDGKHHEVELVVDPSGEAAEITKSNNRLRVYSDAVPVGFWVEDSALKYFHGAQKDLECGSNSWEDWAQRQIEFWNRWSQGTSWLRTGSNRPVQRWRLDRIVVVGDGMLPLAGASRTAEPDLRDHTVQVMCGFPASEVLRRPTYSCTQERRLSNPFYCQVSLFNAMANFRFPAPLEASAKP